MVVDAETNATDLTGLYAAGEVTAVVAAVDERLAALIKLGDECARPAKLRGPCPPARPAGIAARGQSDRPGGHRSQRDPGCHNRSDYPELDETLTKTLEISMDDREVLVAAAPCSNPPPSSPACPRSPPDLDPTGRLTE
ncbi:hypothetical protein ACIBI9_00700 [Nonomuraea sp. NPDC050451]|uniref:hypothetical protein n=1 Tax=Nonomuraea sp. NPDC050451 TaxID=3364364 RepID=UPI0037B6D3FE